MLNEIITVNGVEILYIPSLECSKVLEQYLVSERQLGAIKRARSQSFEKFLNTPTPGEE